MGEQVPARMTVEGTLLDFDRDRYTDKESGEKRETMVLVFQGEKPRYPVIVKVGKDYAAEARAALESRLGSVVQVEVFSGRFGEVWLKAIL